MIGNYRLAKQSILLGAAFTMLCGCSSHSDSPVFNPKTCLQEVPQTVPGVRIISGPRPEKNIIANMQPAYCNGQVLLKLMNESGKTVSTGTVWYKVTAEYNGEVISAEVIKSEIQSPEFLRNVSDMITDLDFTPWQRHDQDAEFIFPMTFSRWWE